MKLDRISILMTTSVALVALSACAQKDDKPDANNKAEMSISGEDWGKIDGHSFKARLLEGTPAPRKWAYVETKGKRFTKTRDFKLYGDGRFYDLRNDPAEKSPVRGDLAGEAAAAKTQLKAALDSVPLPR